MNTIIPSFYQFSRFVESIDPFRFFQQQNFQALSGQWNIASSLPNNAFSWCVKIVHIGSFIGRWFERTVHRIERPVHSLLGSMTNAAFGDNRCLQIAAQVVAITKATLQLILRSDRGIEHGQRLIDALKICVPSITTASYLHDRAECEFNEHLNPLVKAFSSIQQRIHLVFNRVIKVVRDLIGASYRIAEIYDLICMNPYERFESIENLYSNVQEIVDISFKEQGLPSVIDRYRQLFDSVFTTVHPNLTADSVKSVLEKIGLGRHHIADHAFRLGDEAKRSVVEVVKTIFQVAI